MSSGPEAGIPRGEDWSAVERLQDDLYAQPHESELVAELAGFTNGGVAVRDGGPDGPIIVVDVDDAKRLCGCPPDHCLGAAIADADWFSYGSGI